MIKFDVLNRFTGAVQFTAEIECADDALPSVKLGLAVRWALKARANLADANLADAYLAGAYLADANLARANLAGANLAGAKWRDGVVINKQPIQISGLGYFVTILDAHMQIGCKLHSLADWAAFDDKRIAQMDGTKSARFWRDNKDALLAIAKANGRCFDDQEQVAA